MSDQNWPASAGCFVFVKGLGRLLLRRHVVSVGSTDRCLSGVAREISDSLLNVTDMTMIKGMHQCVALPKYFRSLGET